MNTKHSTGCKRVFSRYDATCPRCQELAAGQPARAGWNDMKNRQALMQIEAIRAHDFQACARLNGGVCTHPGPHTSQGD